MRRKLFHDLLVQLQIDIIGVTRKRISNDSVFAQYGMLDQWSNFVRPIQWRCDWLELPMRELSSQVSKYDRELAPIEKQKELQQAVSNANGVTLRSMWMQKGHENSIMKRISCC